MPSPSKLTSSLLLMLATLTDLMSASPLQANRVETRDEWQTTRSSLTCLYLTNEPNWAGEGINLCEVGGTCSTQLLDSLAGNVSSAGPEAGVTCFLFGEKDCEGERSAPLVNPGYADLGAVGFEKRAQSWKCWKWCGWMGTGSVSGSAAAASAPGGSEGGSATASTVGPPPTLFAGLVSITATIDASSVAAQTATVAPGLPSTISASSSTASAAAPTPMSSSASSASSQAQIFETSMTTIVFTHTYADGSKTTITSPLAIPVAVTFTPENVGGTVSMTATEGESLESPAPFTTPGAGVSITTTLSVTESAASASAAGVSITTTEGVPSPVPTLTSEGFTAPVPSVSPSISASPSSSTASAERSKDESADEPKGWTSLVTLTGVDATLTVTATGGAGAGPTS